MVCIDGWCIKEYILAWSVCELDIRPWVGGDHGEVGIGEWKEER